MHSEQDSLNPQPSSGLYLDWLWKEPHLSSSHCPISCGLPPSPINLAAPHLRAKNYTTSTLNPQPQSRIIQQALTPRLKQDGSTGKLMLPYVIPPNTDRSCRYMIPSPSASFLALDLVSLLLTVPSPGRVTCRRPYAPKHHQRRPFQGRDSSRPAASRGGREKPDPIRESHAVQHTVHRPKGDAD